MSDKKEKVIEGPMGYRSKSKVTVLDKKGQPWEVTRQNAYDLVTHNGWKYETPPPTDEDALQANAQSPRNKGKSSQKVSKARDEAEKLKRKSPETKKVGRKKKAEVVVEEEPEDDEPVETFDSQAAADDLEAELDELEAEEEARGKH